jgi:hypothetical protein
MVNDSAALDPLNIAAVSGVCEAPHTDVARAMAAGAGSLLALHGDHANVAAARHAAWLTKPRSMPYESFYTTVASLPAAEQSSLWRRQMVLGPTPEFALLGLAPPALPDTFQPVHLDLTPIWPSA